MVSNFGVVGFIYLLWVLWIQSFLVADWTRCYLRYLYHQESALGILEKKNTPDGKQTKVVEWIDAIIFAVIAATFIRMFFIEAYTIQLRRWKNLCLSATICL